ncbi:hypothetical protein MMC09_004132 [Bachmanniomyces sp. S44760]|nr:hypothetical protein [Bachmanniomyces sp. S44760]
MPSPAPFTIIHSSLPEYCTPENDFLRQISSDFHTCVPTDLAFFSTVLGLLSILSWLFAQLPQIYKNYTLQSTAGLSFYFLLEWCLGDAANLLGALFTGQATWQVVVAGYYVSVDVILVSQYLWYTHIKHRRKESSEDWGGEAEGMDSDNNGEILEGVAPSNGSSDKSHAIDGKATKPKDAPVNEFRFPNVSSSPREKDIPSTSYRSTHGVLQPSLSPIFSPKSLLLVSMLCVAVSHASPLRPTATPTIHLSTMSANPTELVGRVLSWASTILYLGSRLPQIYKNHARRSTAGLSASLFIAAFFGNLFYSTSLLTNPLAWSSYPPHGLHGWVGPEGSDRVTWISLAAPFWLGAAGVLALDATVGIQFLRYGESIEGSQILQVKFQDRKGRSHWRNVSGWMRGWMPSRTFLSKEGLETREVVEVLDGDSTSTEQTALFATDERPVFRNAASESESESESESGNGNESETSGVGRRRTYGTI